MNNQTDKTSRWIRNTATLAATVALAASAAFADPPTSADDAEPIELTAAQMDRISAGSLLLPNGNVQHELFDNPAPNVDGYFGACDPATGLFCHPALTRRSDQVFEATSDGQENTVVGHPDGPWAATSASPVIDCVGAEIPAGMGPNGTGTGCSP